MLHNIYSYIQSEYMALIRTAIVEIQKIFWGLFLLAHHVKTH